MKKYSLDDITPLWLEKKYELPHYRAKLVYNKLGDLCREFSDFDIILVMRGLSEDARRRQGPSPDLSPDR